MHHVANLLIHHIVFVWVSDSISSQDNGFSAVKVRFSISHMHKVRRINVRINFSLEANEMFLSFHMTFSMERVAVTLAIIERNFDLDPSLQMTDPRFYPVSLLSRTWLAGMLSWCYSFWGIPVSILQKSTAGRYRPVRVADGPITARCRLWRMLAGMLPVSGHRHSIQVSFAIFISVFLLICFLHFGSFKLTSLFIQVSFFFCQKKKKKKKKNQGSEY